MNQFRYPYDQFKGDYILSFLPEMLSLRVQKDY